MSGLTAKQIANKLGVKTNQVSEAVNVMCIRRLGAARNKQARPVFLYPPEAVERVRWFFKNKLKRGNAA